MLVVTANWSIGDGTVHGGPPRAAVASFVRDVHRAAWRAGFRRDGLYRPIDGGQIVLAGDTFDGLTSLHWQGDLRPWQGEKRRRATADRVAAAAIRHGGKLLAALRRLRRDGLTVPRADGRGRPRIGHDHRVPISICCLLGDRDRVLEGPWVAAAADRHGIGIGIEWSGDGVTIRHGGDLDPLCGLGWPEPVGGRAIDRPPTLGESLAVDLVVDFARRLHGHPAWGQGGRRFMRRLARAWPLDMPCLVAAAMQSQPSSWLVSAGQRETLRDAWLRAVEHWHTRARASAPDVAAQPDVVDPLATWLEGGLDAAVARPRWPAALAIMLAPQTRRSRTLETNAATTRVAKAGEAAITVLGHPPMATDVDDEAVADGCICLGPPPESGACMAGPRDTPVTLVFPQGRAADAVWFPDDAEGMHGSARQGIVARIGAGEDEPGIVDAA